MVGFTARQGIPLELTPGTFTLVTCLLALFVDKFSASLRTALNESLARERELLHAKERLEHELAVRQQAEAALAYERDLLHALMDNIPDAIYFKDACSRVTRINHAHARLLGLSDPADAVGTSDHTFEAASFDLGSVNEERQIIDTRQPILDRIEQVTDLDGKPRCFSTTKVPIVAEDGRVSGIVGISRDITVRYEVERMKNEFIAIVSHELRTPLTSIQGALGLIAAGALGPVSTEMRTMVDIARRNSARLHHLINDILDIERIETGKLTFTLAPADLGALVAQAAEANDPFAASLGVSLRLCQPIPSITIATDGERLIQVMNNLLSNAIKFSPHSGIVDTTITCQKQIVRVSVTDQGPGIPESFHNRIFSKFTQADSSDTRRTGGAGLGLSITKGIIEQLGGQLGFVSAIDAGTSFYFELPMR